MVKVGAPVKINKAFKEYYEKLYAPQVKYKKVNLSINLSKKYFLDRLDKNFY